MRTPRPSFRFPGASGAVLVALTVLLAAALGYQAVTAAASHRAAVEAALGHHSRSAAWRFTREARSWIGYGMNEAGTMLQHEVARTAALPGPDVLRRVLAEKYCDCMSAAFARTFVRQVVGRDAPLDVSGEPLSERARDDLRDRMRAFAASAPAAGRSQQWLILPPGTPRLNRGGDAALLWRVTDGARRTRAIYGMIVEPAQIERPLIGALENAHFFPPTLVSPAASMALIRVEVAGTNRVAVFARGPAEARFAGSDTLGADYGNLVATASINPSAAQVLVAGGLPPSRVPAILSLLTLTLAMGVAAGLLLRREQRLTQLREDFVSGVSHELRTPLTQIRMLSELLESEGIRTPAERARAVGIIHRESLRLSNLVHNILEFSRLRRVQEQPSLAPPISLGEVAREVAASLVPLLEAQGNRLEVVSNEDVEVRADRDAVSSVLRNLVENAAKYGPSAQTIRLTVTRDNGTARVSVDDEGPGIPAGERERIWQPYYRLDRDRNTRSGSGLGLSVVADLVRQHGGSASVGDAPGRGARFIIELPSVS